MECVCEGASCSGGSWCLGQQCFTSLSVLNGTSVLQKGCVVAADEESTPCRRPPTPEMVVECCAGDLCNMNASLQLPAKGAFLASEHFFLFVLLKSKMTLMHKNMASGDCQATDATDRCAPASHCRLLRCQNRTGIATYPIAQRLNIY